MYSEGANLVIKTKLDDGKVLVAPSQLLPCTGLSLGVHPWCARAGGKAPLRVPQNLKYNVLCALVRDPSVRATKVPARRAHASALTSPRHPLPSRKSVKLS